ncbi:hypothetical protein [Caulobacter segnis]
MSGVNERLALLERAVEEIPALKAEVDALRRFQVTVTTAWAAVAALVAFFAEKIKKALGL